MFNKKFPLAFNFPKKENIKNFAKHKKTLLLVLGGMTVGLTFEAPDEDDVKLIYGRMKYCDGSTDYCACRVSHSFRLVDIGELLCR